MRVKVNSLKKWQSTGAFNTDAGKDAIKKLNEFINMEGQLFEHVWKEIEEREALHVRVEITFLFDAFEGMKFYGAKFDGSP